MRDVTRKKEKTTFRNMSTDYGGTRKHAGEKNGRNNKWSDGAIRQQKKRKKANDCDGGGKKNKKNNAVKRICFVDRRKSCFESNNDRFVYVTFPPTRVAAVGVFIPLCLPFAITLRPHGSRNPNLAC